MIGYAVLSLVVLLFSNSLLTSVFYILGPAFMVIVGFKFLTVHVPLGLAWLATVAVITFGLAFGANRIGVGYSKCIKCTSEYDVQSCSCESDMKEWIGSGKRWSNWADYVKDRMAARGSMCDETNSCCQSCIERHNGYR